jgi:hypothetical protein
MPGDSCSKCSVPRVGLLSFKKLRIIHVRENKVFQNIYCYLVLTHNGASSYTRRQLVTRTFDIVC